MAPGDSAAAGRVVPAEYESTARALQTHSGVCRWRRHGRGCAAAAGEICVDAQRGVGVCDCRAGGVVRAGLFTRQRIHLLAILMAMTPKRYCQISIVLALAGLAAVGIINLLVDPFGAYPAM